MKTRQSVRQVRLFKHGRSQVVRIPRELELPGHKAILRRDEGGRLIVEPLPRSRLLDLLASWEPLREEDQMPVIQDRPAEKVSLRALSFVLETNPAF